MSDNLKDIHKQDQEAAHKELLKQREESQKVFQSFVDQMVKATEEHARRQRSIRRWSFAMMTIVVVAFSLTIVLPALALAWRWFHLK